MAGFDNPSRYAHSREKGQDSDPCVLKNTVSFSKYQIEQLAIQVDKLKMKAKKANKDISTRVDLN